MSNPSAIRDESPALLATAVILGVLATSFASIFINIGLPLLNEEFSVTASKSHWLVSIFISTSTLSLLLTAKLISKFSIRHTFTGFLLLFIATSVLGGFTHNFTILIFCRAAQGAAMGVLSVVAIISMYQAYPIERRGHAGAVFGFGIAMGPTLGPTLAGIIVEYWGWRSVFFAPLPLAVVSLFLSNKILPDESFANDKSFDKIGFALLSITMLGAMSGLSYLQLSGWPLVQTLAIGGLITGLFIAFCRQQKNHLNPLLEISLFKYPVFAAASVISFAYGMGLWGAAFFLPLYLQNAVLMSAWDTGMVMLPSGLVLCLILPISGRLADTLAPKLVVTIGLLAFGSALTLIGLGLGNESFIPLAILIALSRGLGLGMMIPSLDATATRALPSKDLAEGVSVINFLRQLGGAFSPTILMLILEWRLTKNKDLPVHDGILHSYHETFLAIGLLFLLCLLAARKLPSSQ
jgi:EmrB/QacA subfamily drug resistance transporter